MKRARAVIGANYGDEGKGMFTDYLCSVGDGAGVVIRYNGGPQAGHTVVMPDGRRHVFKHVGSGTFRNVPTYLSKYFMVNPLVLMDELLKLDALGITPEIHANPHCLVTTYADMMVNRRIENSRGATRHGSVGFGINETYERSTLPHLTITMADLWNCANLDDKLIEIFTTYASFRSGSPINEYESLIEAQLFSFRTVADLIKPAGDANWTRADPVFEGAQGLLLSQDNTKDFPHVTRSYTGLRNVLKICERAGIDFIEPYYVSRTYLTRHGAGPLPGESPTLEYYDDTNVPHDYQGILRFAPLDEESLVVRVNVDCDQRFDHKLVLTHCDQFTLPGSLGDVYCHGPTAETVEVRNG